MNKIFGKELPVSLYYRLTRLRPAYSGTLLKKLLRIKRQFVDTDLGRFYVDPASNFGVTLLQDGIYEPEMVSALRTFLRAGSVFVDLGANEGYFLVVASQLVGPAGTILGVEPQQRVLPILYQNLTLNGVSNVSMEEVAISNHPGEARMYLYPDTNTGPSGLYPHLRYRVPTVFVRTATLESVFTRHKISFCDLMKCDIEGAEYEAILGSPSLFEERRIKAIALEPHSRLLKARGLTTEHITNFLSKCGYFPDPRFSHGDYRTIWSLPES